MLTVSHSGQRPGPGWHAHGSTTKLLWTIIDERLKLVLLRKQRWLHVATGCTIHDRPVYDIPGSPFGLDVVVLVFGVWLLGDVGLHAVSWPWDNSERPSRRTVQRWHAHLAPHAEDWLQQSRLHIIRHVEPRPLEDLLPTGGIPPPGAVRRWKGPGDRSVACRLREVAWILKNVARSIGIPIRRLLVVARWRWPSKSPAQHPS